MALYRCGGGTKTLTETTLWTNSSPTSNFAGQNVTLLDSINNYSFIKVVARLSTTDATETEVITSVSRLKNAIAGVSSTGPYVLIGSVIAGSNRCARNVSTPDNDVTITFNDAQGIGNSSTYKNRNIPTKIIGIK